MRRATMLTAVVAGLLALGLLAPARAEVAAAEEGAAGSPGAAPAPAGEAAPAEGEPVGSTQASLVVAESLPYIPTSNTIATKLPVELAWTPANVGVVGAPLLAEQDARVVGDALTNVSGLNVQTGNGVFDFFVVRGFDSISSALILTDGAPEPETTFYQLYNAERVEVLKGPGGFLYGSNPLAGAVNIVRKQPVPGSFGLVGAALGSFGTYEGTVDVDVAGEDGRLAFRLNGLWRESDGYRDRLGNSAWAVNPALAWRPSERSRLNLNLELVSSDFTPDAGLPLVDGELPGVPRSRSYHSPFDFSRQDLVRFQADFETELSPALTLRNKTYLRQLDWQTDGTLLLGAFPVGFGRTAVARALLALDDDQRFLGNQLEAVWRGRTGGVEHHLVAGLEVALLGDRFTIGTGPLPLIDLLAPQETAAGPPPLAPLQAGDSEATIVAPYLIDQIALSERLQVLLGARYDAIDFDDPETATARSDGELSPLLGVVYAPAPGWSLYANAARSFAPPSPRVVGEREPEESRQLEIGARRQALGGRLRATRAGDEIERDNIASPDDNGFTQQAGDQRARGVELEVAAEPRPGLTALFAYAYTDSVLTEFRELVPLPGPPGFAVFDRSGNASAFAPEHLANLWLSRRFAGGLGVAGGARWVGEQFIAEDNRFAIDPYLLLSAAVSYAFGDYRLGLHLENLLDEEYETRGFGSASVIPGEPFAAVLRFEVRK